jgi:hypothetical protein
MAPEGCAGLLPIPRSPREHDSVAHLQTSRVQAMPTAGGAISDGRPYRDSNPQVPCKVESAHTTYQRQGDNSLSVCTTLDGG